MQLVQNGEQTSYTESVDKQKLVAHENEMRAQFPDVDGSWQLAIPTE